MKKSRFKTVTAVIVVALAAVAALQVFSLGRMYSDMNLRFAQQVSSAMERSAYEELVGRRREGQTPVSLPLPAPALIDVNNIDSVNVRKSDSAGNSRVVVYSSSSSGRDREEPGAPAGTGKAPKSVKPASRDGMIGVRSYQTVTVTEKTYSDSDSVPESVRVVRADTSLLGSKEIPGNIPGEDFTVDARFQISLELEDSSVVRSMAIISDVFTDAAKAMESLQIYVLDGRSYGFSSAYYSGATLDEGQFARYDSLLTVNLARAGIAGSHKASVVDAATDEVLYSAGGDIADAVLFDMPLGADGASVCRVEVPNPNRGFLIEMGWVIASSILILLLLCFAFIYLLRTMFRQRSVEEMRMDFTHNITHELKTPIAVAYAANDALLNFSAGGDPARRGEYLEVVRDQLDSLSEMVEKILSMSVGEETGLRLQKSEIALKPLLERLLSDYEMKSGKPFSAALTVEPEGLTLRGDRFHLANVIGNLLDNAVKYSGGEVRISLEAVECAGEVCITVSDEGIGIPASALAHIFDKFYRVPTGNVHNVKGFGLGLYYVRLIVEGHEGTVSVRSREGRGTSFSIKIPRYGR